MAYTDRQIIDALDLLRANRGNFTVTSNESGVPDSTLQTWEDRRREWELEVKTARREDREPVPQSRVAKIMAKHRPNAAVEKAEAAVDLPLEKQLQGFLAAVQGSIEQDLDSIPIKDRIRLFGITADKLITLMRPDEGQAAGGSPFLAILQAVQNQQIVQK